MDTSWKEGAIYTIDDIYALPEGRRAELMDGELYMMAAPGMRHQRMVGMIRLKPIHWPIK